MQSVIDSTVTRRSVGTGALWLVVAIVLGLATGASGCDRDRARAVRVLKKGLQAYSRGETVSAVEKMVKAAEIDDDFAKAHYQAAQVYEVDLEEYGKAERHYRDATDIDPDDPKFTYGLARVLAAQGDYEEAISYYRKTIDNDKKHGKAWFRLGIAQRTLGKHADAVDSFMKAIEVAPRLRMDEEDTGGAQYHALGDLYVEFGFYDKALKVYENGLVNNSKCPRLFQGRGVAQLELERYEAAAESFQKALEIDESNTSALYNLAVARQKMGKPEEAIKVLEKFLRVANRGDNRARIAAAQGLMNKLEDELEKKKSD
ncbi:MAG: tetratricopeptide repeat protein [Bradymonadaceae bacterium]